jgi:hypothetical protein
MTSVGKLVNEVDEDGEDVPPGGDGGPNTRALLKAIQNVNKDGTSEEDRTKYVRKLKRAAKALIETRGDAQPDTPEWPTGTWLASVDGLKDDNTARMVAVVIKVHGVEVIGWQTRGPDADGDIDFDPIRRGNVRAWGLATDIDPAIIEAAQAQGLL